MIRLKSAILLIFTFVLCADGTFSSQINADWEWVGKYFGATLDRLMPLERTTGFYVVYRAPRGDELPYHRN